MMPPEPTTIESSEQTPDHERLLSICPRLPTDYTDYGGQIERWADGDDYPDCSGGCRWARWLNGQLGADWCVCTKPGAPRAGLLTFEHMAGRGCFDAMPPSPVTTLFNAIAHGSDVHRAWLKKAIEDHFAGRPVEPPLG